MGELKALFGLAGSVRGPSRADNVLINPAHPRFREISENASAVFTWPRRLLQLVKLRLARTESLPHVAQQGGLSLSQQPRRFWQFLTQICQFDETLYWAREPYALNASSVRSTAARLSPGIIERGNFSAVTSNDPNLDPFSPALRMTVR